MLYTAFPLGADKLSRMIIGTQLSDSFDSSLHNCLAQFPLKTIDFSYFNSVDANKSNAIDWSSKLDLTNSPTIQYKIDGYAQNNLLSYETDDNDKHKKFAH